MVERMNKHNFPADIKKYSFQMKDFLGVDFTTHESGVGGNRSPDALNVISGSEGSMDKRFGTEIIRTFAGRIWAVYNVKTFVFGLLLPDGTRPRFDINVTIVHEGTRLWAHNPHLGTWQRATYFNVGETLPFGSNVELQERETNFIEYSNQNFWTIIHNNWMFDRSDLLTLWCSGSTMAGQEGTINFQIQRNDPLQLQLYMPTTSIGRSPNGRISTPFEEPNQLVNARINRFLSNATDTTYILDFNGETFSMGGFGGLISQMMPDGTWGSPHNQAGEPITWTYNSANRSVTFSAVPASTYTAGADNIEIRFFTQHSVRTVTNIMNDYLSYANHGFNGLNNLTFFCNHRETRHRNQEICIYSKNQNNEAGTVDRLYLPQSLSSNLGSNRKIGYSKLGKYLILHGVREGNSPVAYLKELSLDDRGEIVISNTPTTSQVSAIAPKSFDNLRDDPLWVSDAGVSAIVIDNITSVESIQDRGFYINKKLLNEPNLDKAVSFVFESKYFVCVNGNVYVADSRHKSIERKSYSESFQYEWYYWEGLDVQTCVVVDGELLFGTMDGRLMKYKNENSAYPYCDEVLATPTLWTTATNYIKGNIVHDGLNNYYVCLVNHLSTHNPLEVGKYWNKVIQVGTRYQIPVISYWTTPIMNMGDITMRKTLKNLWVRLGKHANMSARIYYSTQGIVSEKYDGIFDFSDIDFSRFTFSTDTDPSVLVTNRAERKFMSIQFKVESRDANPFSLLEIVGKYTFNNQFKG